MSPVPKWVEESVPEGWSVAVEEGEQVSVTHDERDVAVIVQQFHVTGDEVRSRSDTAPERTVFEIGYRPPDVEAKSLHVSTVESSEMAERLMHEAIRSLDD